MKADPLALPLLHHLRQELLGNRLPVPGVPFLFGYVLYSPQADSGAWLTSLI